MIDHDTYRRAILADPKASDAELRAHLDGCEQCRAFTEKLTQFESRLERALNIDLPSSARSAQVLPFQRKKPAAAPRRRWYALAASVIVALLAAGTLWLAFPRTSLAADVVAHMADEPNAWNTQAPLAEQDLAKVLNDAKVRLLPGAGPVSYASSCVFRGRHVPHLVVQTGSGPVTVMVLAHESVNKAQPFDEQGYRGTIVPVPGHGSIAVLMQESRTPTLDVKAIASRVRDAMIWTD
jgi:Protein of unknown function (DUF3379)